MAHIGIELTPLPVHQKKENSAFVLYVLKLRFRLIYRPYSRFFFWAAWASGNDALKAGITAQIPIRLLADCCFHEKAARCPSSYSKAFRLLGYSENLAAGLPFRSRATYSNLRCPYPTPCTLYRTILSCYIAWYARCREVLPPMCDCRQPVSAHGESVAAPNLQSPAECH